MLEGPSPDTSSISSLASRLLECHGRDIYYLLLENVEERLSSDQESCRLLLNLWKCYKQDGPTHHDRVITQISRILRHVIQNKRLFTEYQHVYMA